MGTTPNIRVKGVSRMAYNFLWDPEIRHYAYLPQSQKECDDIFRTQGKMYKHLYFSVWLEEEAAEEADSPEEEYVEKMDKPAPRKKRSSKSKKEVAEVV